MIKLYGNLNQNKNAVKNAWVAGLDCRRTGDGTGRWVGLQRKQ